MAGVEVPWLPQAEEEALMSSLQAAPKLLFASLAGWAGLHALAKWLLNRKRIITSPAAVARMQHGLVLMVHSFVALALSALLLYDAHIRGPASSMAHCAGRALCFEPQRDTAAALHAGFLLYELFFFSGSLGAVRQQPWAPFLFLHHVLYLAAFVTAKLFPCRLSLDLLPWHQLLAAASIPDGVASLLVAFRAPKASRLAAARAVAALFTLRAVGTAAAAAYAYVWAVQHDLWNMRLASGPVPLARPYAVLYLGGGALLAFISVVWAITTRDMATAVASAVVVPGKEAAGNKDASSNGSSSKKKGRR